jgi:ABC-type multidrug transport system fused ATPase/permease subunit
VSFSEFVLFQILFSYVDGALWGMAWFVTRSGVYLTTYEKLIHTFDKFPKIIWYNTWNPYQKGNWDIQIKEISFKYKNGNQLFSDFSLHLQGKKKTALVGSSWSGKSTLIKVISGYIRPDSGSIIIDNQNLADISLESYYQHIGYLTQEPSVFDGTIRENLEYGITSEQNAFSSPSQSQMDEIIQLAQCQFIYDLPKWLDTQIGEKWIKLSGGQRQRLAIAKVMLKNPSIILLDEPTSALDSFAEEEVTRAMNNLFEWRTVIIVAHRLQTVKHADEIIVLGNIDKDLWDQSENSTEWSNTEQYTQILERGTHEELIAKWGYYAKMLELQSGF